MGGRPYPSTLEVTRTRPRREEWPCPGSRGRHASWRQCSAQRSAACQSQQRHTAKLGSTRQHTAHSMAEQSKAVYHNNGGGQPHHPPQAPAPAQHPTRGQTHHTGTSPTYSHRRPQTRHTRKPQRQAPGARTRPRQWVGVPIQALWRLPDLGPDRGCPWVAAAATPQGGSVAHNAEAAQHTT